MSFRDLGANIEDLLRELVEKVRRLEGALAGYPDADTAASGGVSAHDDLTGVTDAQHAHDILSDGHSDVFTTDTPADGDVLTWVDANSRWEAVAGGSGASGHTIQEDHVDLTDRTNLNFAEGLVASDDAGNDATDVDADWSGVGDITDVAATEAAGSATTIPRGDHRHAHGSGYAGGHTDAVSQAYETVQDDGVAETQRSILNFQDGFAVVDDGVDSTDVDLDYGSPTASVDIGDAQADGSATTVPRSDHQHEHPAPGAGYPVDVAATEDDGVATTPARSDHRHAHGSGYAGGHTDVAAHATTHSDGGSDEVTVENLATGSTDTSTALRPDGGGGLAFSDVAHADLTGVGTDDHHAQAHAAAHSDGGADEVTVENLATASTDVSTALRPDGSGGLAFSDVAHADLTGVGANDHHAQAHDQNDHDRAETADLADVAATADAGTSVEVPNADHRHAHGSGYAGGHTDAVSQAYETVQDDGVAETQRSILNFQDGFVVTDDAVDSTDVDLDYGSPTGAIDIGDAQSDGSATTVARSDHQHAFDAPAAGYPVDVDTGAEADGSATTPARSDHKHAFNAYTDADADITGDIDIGDAAAHGSSSEVARADHQHAFDAPAAGYPVDVAATEDDGAATTAARSDHRHAHGSGYAGGHTDVAAHASTHSDGGSDEVTVENLATASTDTSQVLTPDGSGGLQFASVPFLSIAKWGVD